jgi:transcriptional regulator with XRE-family HTH domain
MYKPDQSGQFGESIKRLLQARGLSQRKFAERAGLETDYVSKLVNGKIAEPRQDAIAKIAKGLELTPEELNRQIQRLNSEQLGSVENSALLNLGMNRPHPQPLSPGRRSQISDPLSFWERARVRVGFAIHPFIQQRQTLV